MINGLPHQLFRQKRRRQMPRRVGRVKMVAAQLPRMTKREYRSPVFARKSAARIMQYVRLIIRKRAFSSRCGGRLMLWYRPRLAPSSGPSSKSGSTQR